MIFCKKRNLCRGCESKDAKIEKMKGALNLAQLSLAEAIRLSIPQGMTKIALNRVYDTITRVIEE